MDDNVVLEPGATVFPNKTVPGGFVYAGSPAKPVRALAAGEVAERRAKMAREHEGESVTVPRAAIAAASQVHPSVFIASTAAVRGRLIAAEASSIWYSNSFDAGEAAIPIGARTNIQDNTVIRCSTPQGVDIGRDSTVGHNVTLHDCAIGNGSLIGIGSVVARGHGGRRPGAAGRLRPHHARPGAGERLDVRRQSGASDVAGSTRASMP